LGNLRGQNWADLTRMKTEPNPYKEMTPSLTQNLKALGILFYMLLNFLSHSWDLESLGYLTNLPLKWESLSHWYTPPRAEAFSNSPKPTSGRLLIQGQTVLAQAANHLLWYHLLGKFEGEIPGRSQRMRT